MATDNPRIEELRRRVQQDSASIAFAQLAEEYRRSGHLQEAVSVCRAGLVHHPSYVSARVTLGRALMALGHDDEAQAEFEYVLRAASDNLVALRSLEELRSRRDASLDASPPKAADAFLPARVDPVLEELEGWLAAILADRAARTAHS